MDYLLLFNQYKNRQSAQKQPQQRLLYNCLRESILNGQLSGGTRMLGSRSLALELKLARNSVLYAYEHLVTEGLLITKGRQTWVSYINTKRADVLVTTKSTTMPLSSRAQLRHLPIDPNDTITTFVTGVPALAEFPLQLWRRYIERAWRKIHYQQLNYGDASGEPLLRAAIADHLTSTRGVICSMEQIVITDGTQHSLDLCAYALAGAGDTAWIENPSYTGVHQAFKAAELNVQGINVDENGMAPSENDWLRHPPKLIYTTPSHQFPLGSVMSVARRLALIEAAKTHGAIIIEDDYDSEFRRDGPPMPAMQGLAADAPVVYLGTFSKTLFPALRIGFMVLPAGLVTPFTEMLRQRCPRGRSADQLALADFLRSGQFAIHLRKMRRLYAQRRDTLVAGIETLLGDIVKIYGGSSGIHLTIELPNALSDEAISKAALTNNICATPISLLATGAILHKGLMLGYAQTRVEHIPHAVAVLAGIIRRALSEQTLLPATKKEN